MRAFVTGATGFIGGALARALVTGGWDVTAMVRDISRAEQLTARGVALAPGDVTDAEAVRAAVKNHDVVFHFAAMYAFGPADRAAMERTNVEGTRNVLYAAADAGIERVVYCSSSTVLGRNPAGGLIDESTPHTGSVASFYEQTKLAGYRVAREGAAAVAVMPTAVYGPGDRSLMGTMIRLWATGKLLAAPFLDVGVSFVHVDDVARGSIAAAERGSPGEDYLLAGDNETIGGALRRAGAALGMRAPRFKLPVGLLRAALPLVAPAMGYTPAALREAMATLSTDLLYSSEKARRDLGYTFRPVEEGFADCLATARG